MNSRIKQAGHTEAPEPVALNLFETSCIRRGVHTRTFGEPRRVRAWNTIDASVFGNLSGGRWGRGTRLILSVQNLLDEGPPFVRPAFQGFSWDATNASVVGRFVSLELVREW